jgi:peroxiredoxin
MIATLILLSGLTGSYSPVTEPAPVVRTFDLSDAAGKKHSSKEWAGSKAIVLFFISAECPASNGYAPELKRLSKEFADKGVQFYGVHSDPDLTAAQALTHAKDYELPFPVLMDAEQALAKQIGATRVPTAVILSPEGTVLYRGRIDNRYVSLGKKRTEPTVRDTQENLTLVLAGKAVPVSETEVFGCYLPPPAEKKPKQAQ